MSKLLTFAPGVAPDVSIYGSKVHVVFGHEPWTWLTLSPGGDLLEKRTQPRCYFPKTNGRVSVGHDGEKFLWWGYGTDKPAVVLGQPVGNNPTGISSEGIEYYQRAEAQGFALGVYCGSVRIREYRPTGIWESHNDGTVTMMDDCNRTEPWSGGYVHHAPTGEVVVAEGASGGVVGRAMGTPFHIWGNEDCRWPRCAVAGNVAAIVCWDSRGPTVKLWLGTVSELAATVDPPVPPPSIPPIVEPPMSVPNHLSTVVAFRDAYPKDRPLGAAAAWEITNAVAYQHRDEGFGLRRKLEGQNHNGYSIDVIIHKPTGTWIDILGSSETDGIPQWALTTPAGPTDEYWFPPLPPEDAEPPIPPPTDDLESRVAYLEQVTQHIITHLRTI